MPTYVFTYRMPSDYAPGGGDVAADWEAWFNRLGASLSDRGNPVFESTALGTCGDGTSLGRYTFVTAADFESAVALAKGSPALEAGGGVEVGAIRVLNADSPSSGHG
jgi:hypothetical protein